MSKTSEIEVEFCVFCRDCGSWNRIDGLRTKKDAAAFFEKEGWIFAKKSFRWLCPQCQVDTVEP